jgi:hypothetical protein
VYVDYDIYSFLTSTASYAQDTTTFKLTSSTSHSPPSHNVLAADNSTLSVVVSNNQKLRAKLVEGHRRYTAGWSWSKCIKPLAGTNSCKAPHTFTKSQEE